jgi:hypothetical protein
MFLLEGSLQQPKCGGRAPPTDQLPLREHKRRRLEDDYPVMRLPHRNLSVESTEKRQENLPSIFAMRKVPINSKKASTSTSSWRHDSTPSISGTEDDGEIHNPSHVLKHGARLGHSDPKQNFASEMRIREALVTIKRSVGILLKEFAEEEEEEEEED